MSSPALRVIRNDEHLQIATAASSGRWQEQALCSQSDPEAWFPEKGGSVREAKRICARCPVKTECLEWALGTDQRYGVAGGLSERERRKLKRRAA